jgi:hypothetical protein
MKNGINFATSNHKMKKSFVIIIIAMLMGCFKPLSAQIIYTEEDAGLNPRAQAQGDFNVMVPMQGVSLDQWKITPLGNGFLLLAGMGGAYLLSKRKKSKED